MSLVVVQRGHVPRRTGATGAPGEQQFAIDTAARLRHHLVRLGHDVRVIDADVADAQYRGDAFVALHYDSSANPSARGASVGYQTPEGQRLAASWKQHYTANGWTGGWRGDNYTAALGGYYGVRRAVNQGNRLAIITEAGFHSSPADAALLRAPAGPERVALTVAAALMDHLGCRGIPAPTPPAPRPPAAGSETARIVELQGLLRVPGDGIVGPRTVDAMAANMVGWRRDLSGNGQPGLVMWLQRQGNRKGYACRVDGDVGPEVNHLIVVVLGQADGICGPNGYRTACR